MTTAHIARSTGDPNHRARWRGREMRAAAAVLQTYARSLSEQASGRVAQSSQPAAAAADLSVVVLDTTKHAARTRRSFSAGARAFACRTA
jgi:hypothetical protein